MIIEWLDMHRLCMNDIVAGLWEIFPIQDMYLDRNLNAQVLKSRWIE